MSAEASGSKPEGGRVPAEVGELPAEAPTTQAEAVDVYRKSADRGVKLSGRELGELFGKSDSWGRAVIRSVKEMDAAEAETEPLVSGPEVNGSATERQAEARPEVPEVEAEAPEGEAEVASQQAEAPEGNRKPGPVAAEVPEAPAEAGDRQPEAVTRKPEVGAEVERGSRKSAEGETEARRKVATWPIMLLALPAFVAVWSGWVGLGEMAGFGMVDLLPGIVAPGGWATINTAITLPIGVETYGAYALRVWLASQGPSRARGFAKWSAIASLLVGALGQVAYHLLAAAGVGTAPWWVTTLVACLPVAVLGMGAALAHMSRH